MRKTVFKTDKTRQPCKHGTIQSPQHLTPIPMSSDFRYHVASLAAVFLALGIGILVGTAFVGAPVVDRQTRLIRRLETNVGELRRETRERERFEDGLRRSLPALVRGKLAGRRVFVLQTGAYAGAADSCAEAARLAGADVTRAMLPPDKWRVSAETDPEATTQNANVAADAKTLARLLARADADSLKPLRERGLLEGGDLNTPPSIVVFVGGGRGNEGGTNVGEPWETELARIRDVALAEEFIQQQITVIGTEPYTAGVSFVPVYRAAGLPTIDCIDRPLGQIALSFISSVDKIGNPPGEAGAFGMKETADRSLPDSVGAEPTLAPSATPAPALP